MANFKVLLRNLAQAYPHDTYRLLGSEGADLEGLTDLPNVQHEVIPLGRSKETTRLDRALRTLPAIARRGEIDVVWALNLGAYRRMAVPQLLSAHNPHQIYPWSTLGGRPASLLRLALLRWFFRRSLAVSSAVIVQTPLMANYLRRSPQAPAWIAVIPKAVETSFDVRWEPLPTRFLSMLERSEGSVRYLYVATGYPHKNHEVLIHAADLLAQRGVRCQLVFTVDEPEVLHLGGERAAKLLETGTVVPLGWVEKRFLRALYAKADACVMPSLLESLSSAHLEAMRWERPQVSSDLPYARDLCGSASLYASPRSALEWAGQMERLVLDQHLRETLVANGRRRIACYPELWREVADRVHEVLGRLAGSLGPQDRQELAAA